MRKLRVTILLVLFTLAPLISHAQTSAEIPITVNAFDMDGNLERSETLVLCLAGNSVNLISEADVNDVIVPPIPPGGYDVRLRNPDIPSVTDAKKDCRALPSGLADVQLFRIVYQPGPDVTSIELLWDPDDIRGVDQFGDVTLSDPFGGAVLPTIQMADNSEFTISNTDPGFDLDFQVSIGFVGLFLPVELLDFDANLDGNKVGLNWSTATESNNSGFEIQMKSLQTTWSSIGFVAGSGTTLERKDYSFNVGSLEAGVYTFRLKQIDFDGAFEFHPEVQVQVELPGTHSLSSAYPNPFNPSTSFSLIVRDRQNVKIDLVDALGTTQRQLFDGVLSAGSKSNFTIDATGLPTGVYFYRVQGDQFLSSGKVILLR